MNEPVHIVIPARFGASRLPGKPLRELAGRPLVEWVWRCARAVTDAPLVATDDPRIADACRAFGAEVEMTAADHPSGTDRLAEVAARRGWADEDIVVNLQGDEPLTPAANLAAVIAACRTHTEVAIATLCEPLSAAEIDNPNAVKVVRDRNGLALYFSRAGIPFDRDGSGVSAQRHIGLYAYRCRFLQRFGALEPAPIEGAEQLEQLRAMWHGERIVVADAPEPMGPGVDTAEDLARVARLLAGRG